MARSAWDIMTGATGSVRGWAKPGLDMLGTKSTRLQQMENRSAKAAAKKPAKKVKPHTYKEHRDGKEMDLLDELNNAMGMK